MNDEKDILNSNKKLDPTSIYNIPNDYFNGLNKQLNDRINKMDSKKPRIIFFNRLLKVAAVLLLLIGSYYLFNKPSNDISINYSHLNESIDDYLLSDDELFYTFVNEQTDDSYLNINENISDYFETELTIY